MLRYLFRYREVSLQANARYLDAPNADGDEARTLRPLQAAAITYRISASVWTLSLIHI